MFVEFVQQQMERRALHFELVERLDRGETRGGAGFGAVVHAAF
jgi:hypothetical protein